MFESKLSSVIYIDTNSETVHFYNASDSGTVNYNTVNYKARPFDEDFYNKIDRVLKNYLQGNPSLSFSKISLVLPDHVFLTDTVSIPSIGKKAMEQSLNLAIGAIYPNSAELKYRTHLLSQNKQFATYGLVAMRKDLIDKLNELFRNNQISVQNITSAANARANGSMVLNPKLKNGTFLLLDIEEDVSNYAFVNKGRTLGAFSLPFGHSMLYKTRLAAEDMLFDYSSAELLVLNAKEKAKSKQLTMMGEEVMTDPDAEEHFGRSEDDSENLFGMNNDSEFKKTARKLPKFMLRDTPTDREGFIYENFRIFVKWTLDIIASNSSITSLGAVDTVYVNMPSEYSFLYDVINAEADENRVKFQPLGSDSDESQRLALFGGLNVKQYNKMNNF